MSLSNTDMKRYYDKISSLSPQKIQVLRARILALPPQERALKVKQLKEIRAYGDSLKTQQPKDNRGMVDKTLSSLGIGVTKGGEELVNLAGRMVGKKGPVFADTSVKKAPYHLLAELAKGVPTIAGAGGLAAIAPEAIPDMLTGMVGQAAAATGVSDAAGAASEKGTTLKDIGKRGLEGVGIGTTLGLGGKVGEGLIRANVSTYRKGMSKLKDVISKRALKPLEDKLSKMVGDRVSKISMEPLIGAYEKAKEKAKDYGGIAKSAVNLDKKLGLVSRYIKGRDKLLPKKPQEGPSNTFDLNHYNLAAKKILTEAEEKERADPAVEGVSNALKNVIKRAPASFEDAVTHKQVINHIPDSYNDPAVFHKKALLRKYATRLGKALDYQTAKNAKKLGADDFIKDWKQKRLDYGNYKKFYQNPRASGKKLDYGKDLEQMLKDGNYEKYLKTILPKEGEEGGRSLEHLSDLLGSREKAKDLLHKTSLETRNIVYKNSLGNTRANPAKLSNYFKNNKIPQHVRALLTNHEQELLGNRDFVKDILGQMDKQTKGSNRQMWSKYVLPTIVGGAIGEHFHHPLEGLTAGAGSTSLGPKLMETMFKDKALKYMENGTINDLRKIAKDHTLDTYRAYREHIKNEMSKKVPSSKTMQKLYKYPLLELSQNLTHNKKDKG